MNNQLKIEAVMHPFPFTIGIDQSLRTALDMLHEHTIRHLPVCEGGQLCGILSDRDIEFALRVDQVPPTELFVKDCYTPEPFTVPVGTPVAEAARKMAHDRIGCALVVENSRVLGIFTAVDACRVLAEVLSGKKEQ